MFFDLNIRRPANDPLLVPILIKLSNLGYDAVAITTELTEEDFSTENKKKGKQGKKAGGVVIPEPLDVLQFSAIQIQIFNRVNIAVNNASSFHKISQTKQLKAYDIISYFPGNSNVLKALTSVPDFDILCFNPAIDSPPLHFNRKLYNQFVQNGVYMELPYSPAILDSTSRKYCIFTAHVYHAVGKSNNIIVTSAAAEEHHLRLPYDVVNLCALYGLSEEQAKHSITRNCSTLLLKARTRRRGKSTIEMTYEEPPVVVIDDIVLD